MSKVQPAPRSSAVHAPSVTADTYVVKAGDSLSRIAKEHGVSLQKVISANPQIENPNLILVGQHIHLPGKPHKAAPSETDLSAAPRKAAPPKKQEAARQHAAQAGDSARERVPGAAQPRPAPVTHPAPATTPRNAVEAGKVRSTAGMGESQKYDYYRGLVEAHGGKFHDAPNARNIVGLRHETNPNSNAGHGANDDKFATLWVDKSGHKHVKEYTGTTEGIAANRPYSSDVNGDHQTDLGRIPTGYYEYAPGYSNRLGNVLRPTRAFQVQRDSNHDGKFAGNKELHADTSNAFLFHQGSSAGCQTMPDGVWDRFWTDINSSGKPSRIGYTLIDVGGR